MSEKYTNETHRTIPTIKVFLFLIVMLMTITMVSALQIQESDWRWDNTKAFVEEEGEYGTYHIKDSILKLWDLGKVKDVTLKSNTFKCGNDCEAVKEITNYKQTSLIDDVRFYRLYDDGSKELSNIRSYEFLIKTGEEAVEVNDYELQCNNQNNVNGSNYLECSRVKIGSHTEYIKEWEPYDLGTIMPIGNYEIKLKGKKKAEWTYDWQVLTSGIWTDEWSIWGGSGATSFWTFNQTTGDVTDSVGINNGTNSGATRGVIGIINNSFEFDNSNDEMVNVSDDPSLDFTNTLSINVWVNITPSIGLGIIQKGALTGDTGAYSIFTTGAGLPLFRLNNADGSVTGTVDVEDSTWHMITATYDRDASNMSIYVDGVIDGSTTYSTVVSTNADQLFLGCGFDFNNCFEGRLDEIGLWNRVLTQTEITDLWNGGAGISFGNLTTSSVTLNSPVDNFVSPSTEIEFNASATVVGGATLVNMSLYHNASGTFERNQTNIITGVTNTTTFNETFTDGEFITWSIQGCDTDGDCGFASENRTASVDVSGPEIAILFPDGPVASFAFGNTLDLNWSINDTNLDSCFFEYNTINTSLTCGDNTTTFTPVEGFQSLRVYANDSVGNINFKNTSWTYDFLEKNVTFNLEVFETDSEEFELNLTTDIDVLTINSFLIYNGVSDRSTATCTEDGNCTLMNVIDIPLVSDANETENKTFFWSITIFNGTDSISLNTSERQQNVTKIHIEECDATFTTPALNFTAFDEQNLSVIDPFLWDGDFLTWLGSGSVKRQTNISAGSVSSESLCITPNATHFIDGQVTYDHPIPSTYVERNYWFQNDTISNVSQDIELALLLSGSSTSFILKVQDTNILPVPDVLIYTERFYPGEGAFRIVQVAKSDDNGGSIGFFETETADYRFILKQQSFTVLTTNDQKVVGESAPFTLTFTIGEAAGNAWDDFEDTSELEQSLTFNSSNNVITFSYTDTSGEFTSGSLAVERLSSNGSDNIVICNTTSFQSSATILCDITGNESGTYSAQGIIIRTTETITGQILVQVLFGTNDFTNIAGDYGLFLGWFVILIGCFAFKFNEIAGIFMINVMVIGVNIIGLIHFGPVFISAMIALSIFVAVILER